MVTPAVIQIARGYTNKGNHFNNNWSACNEQAKEKGHPVWLPDVPQ